MQHPIETWLSTVLLTLALLVAAPGCSGSNDPGTFDAGADGEWDDGGDQGVGLCQGDVDCPQDQVCLDGICRPEDYCLSSADCQAGHYCSLVIQRCVEGQCLQDADCVAGMRCEDYQCRGMCEGVECDSGQVCDPADGGCIPMPCTISGTACETDAECPPGLHCDPMAHGCTECPTSFFCNIHECFAVNATCRDHSDCGAGDRCNPETMQCEPFPESCGSDAECSPRYCNLYTHTCQADPFTGDCSNDQECQLAFGEDYYCHQRLRNCVLPLDEGSCYDTEDCADAGLVCDLKTNTCAERGTICGVDSDCDGDDVCVNGVCIFVCPVACEQNEECMFGQICHNNCCLEDRSCGLDADCTYPEECMDGWCTEPLPCLSDDAFEDNDSGVDATVLNLPPQDQTEIHAGLYVCERDDDWFAVQVPAGSTFSAAILFSHSTGDLDMKLYDDPAGSNPIDSSTSTSNSEQVGDTPAADTTYYIRVYGFGGAVGPYELQLIHGQGGVVIACVGDDGYEENDDWASAASLSLPAQGTPDQYPGLHICEDDPDWYEVLVPAGIELTVRINFSYALGDLELDLFSDPTQAPIASSDTWDDDEEVSGAAVTDQHLYFAVSDSDYNFTSNSYDLILAANPVGHHACSPDDALEENDSAFNATLMPLPPEGQTTQTPDLILCAEDEDWYRIDLAAGDALEARVAFDHSAGDLELGLYDANMVELDHSTSASDQEIVSTTRMATDATVFLLVYGYAGAANDYLLELENTGNSAAECSDGGNEPNEDAASATSLGAGSYPDLTLCDLQPRDEDWYSVQVPAGQRLRASISFDTDDGDLELALYDASGATQIDSSTSSGANETVIGPRAAQDTTYAIRVYPFSLDADASYQLDVVLDPPLDCTDGGNEPNDDSAQATPAAAGLMANLTLCQGNPADVDWYRLSVPGGSRLHARIDFDGDEADLDLFLYDASGTNELDSSAGSYADSEQVDSARLQQDTELLLLVRADGLASDTSYDLEVTLDPVVDCSDNGLEPNEDAASAASLAAGTLSGLTICQTDPVDQDWYAVTILDGERLHVDIAFDGSDGDLELYLFDDSGSTQLDSSTSAGDQESVSSPRADGQTTFLVQVMALSMDTDVAYDIQVQVEPPIDCSDGGNEPNDQLAAATPVASGQYPGLLICQTEPLDEDWYVVSIQAGERLHAGIDFDNDDGNLDLQLFSADGATEIDSSTSGYSDHEEVAGPRAGAATDYLIRVSADADDFTIDTTYQLDVAIDPPLQCADDPYEPNDGDADATALAAPGSDPMTLCPGNLDMFQVDVSRGQALTFLLVNTTGLGDIDLVLYDPDGLELDQADSNGTGAEQLEFQVYQDGRYTLAVIHHDADSEQNVDYRLDLFVDTFTPCDTDAYEPNDSELQATVLSDMNFSPSGADWLLELIDLQVCKPGPADWFAIDLDLGDALTVNIRFSHADGDIDAYLYDENLNTVDSSTSSSDDELLELDGGAETTGRYYIKTFMYTSDTTNSYDLEVISDRPFP